MQREGIHLDKLRHMEKGIYVNESEDKLRGITIFNESVGEPEYVEAILRDAALEVACVTCAYV